MNFQSLGDVVDVIGGGTPSKKVPRYYGGDIPWATVRDMNTDWILKTDHTITKEGLDNSSSKIIPKNEIVIATRVGLGKVCLLGQDTAINQDLRGLIPKTENTVNRKYLFYWYKSIAQDVVSAGTGATVQGVKLPFINGLRIPLPPLEEQRRIVVILDTAFEGLDRARTNTEANLESAKGLFEGYIARLFREYLAKYDVTTLEDVCGFRNGKAHEKSIDKEGDIVVVNSKFISSGGKVRKFTGVQLAPLKKGDIAMVMSDVPNGRALAKCHLIDEDKVYSLNQRICKITSEVMTPEFLFFQLNRHPHLLNFNNGENQTNLRKGDILATPMRVPPIEKQKELVEIAAEVLESSRKAVYSIENKKSQLENLRQSLLQKAFAGELT